MVSLQGPGPTEHTPNPSQLSSSLGRGTKALPAHWSPQSPLQGLNFSALPFQSSLLLSFSQWHHEPQTPQILLSKTKLKAPPPPGVLSLSPLSVEILELPLLPLCSFLHSSSSSPHMCPTSPSLGWSPLLPSYPPRGYLSPSLNSPSRVSADAACSNRV